jgi:signal transduction histidine kinase
LDITNYQRTLSSLLYTLLSVGIILLLVILLISFYFSGRVIRPIAETWEKQRQFIADASHELKTPLTIIKSNLGIAASNPHSTVSEQMEWLDYVNIGADKMAKLVDDLLTLANADRADFAVTKESFDISDAMLFLVRTMTARAGEKDIDIATSIQPELELYSDRERIMQVATILLDNAIKYANHGGSVHVSLTKIKQHISLSVTNSGVGIKKTEQSKIFDRFYQADQSRSGEKSGYGLGLSIVKVLAERLGGSLSVVSEENEATTFTLVL